MCIAAIINKPMTLQHLVCMQEDNPHGGGVAWLAPGDTQVSFKRDLTAKDIFTMQEGGELTFPYLLHFRWATHGGITPHLTHPFPTGIRALMGELSGRAPQVMIHNGVWQGYKEWLPALADVAPKALIDAASDTAIAALLYEVYPEVGDEIPWAVASATVFDGALMVRKHGDVWESRDGNEYSNLTWLPFKERWPEYASKGYRFGRGWTNYRSFGDADWEPYMVSSSEDDTEALAIPKKQESEARKLDDGKTDPREWADWYEYLCARYGKEVADSVQKDYEGCETPGNPEGLDLDDPDFMSDDPAVVQAWMDRQVDAQSADEYMRAMARSA